MQLRLSTICCLALVSTVAFAQAPNTNHSSANPAPDGLPQLEKFDPALIDKSKDACTDFYAYTCSKWVDAHPIPADLPGMSTSQPLRIYNQTILRQAMEKAAADKSATGSERQIGDFWTSCMDESVRNKNGASWLKPYLDTIATLKSKRDLARVVAYVHLNFLSEWGLWNQDDNYSKQALFGFGPAQDLENSSMVVAGVDQGGMALPSLQYYLSDEDRYKDIRSKYLAHIQQLLEMTGEPADKAAASARTVLDIETALAKPSMDNVTRRDPKAIYNKKSRADLKAAVSDFDWDDYLERVGAPTVPFYIVSTPKFLDAMEQQIKTRSVEDWQAYLRWWAAHRGSPYMTHAFEQANFDFFATTLIGVPQMQPQWRRCVQSADQWLGEALGQAYVNIAFPPESKVRANELVSQIRGALNVEIQQLDWMSDATKKQALQKQQATVQKIGYPDKFRDYSSVKIVPDNYLANATAANAFEGHREINKIGKPVDRLEWGMTPATINAYEDPQLNTINFPAGILQLPFFSGSSDDPSNYGAIGMVIGHETIHGFDDEGRKFDAQGNLRDWWTPEDAKHYDEKDQCIVSQYSQEVPEYGVKQDGRLTAGEDTADNGGIHLAILALEAKYKQDGKSLDTPEADGLTARQRFFLSYAFGWCAAVRPEAARNQIATNPHSLPKLRVNRPLSNLPEFQQAFGCKPGQAMVHAPACRVW